MPGQNAPRYGLEVQGDLELELRLRRIETQISKRAITNDDATTLSRGRGSVPQVTGLSLGGTIPGGLTVKWNAVSIGDLKRYELQFATDISFATGLQKFNAAGTSFPFTTGGGGGITYYARVRAVNSYGRAGLWSATLNTATGQATNTDISINAVNTTNIVDGAVTDDKVSKSDPITFAGMILDGYINGLILSNNSSDSAADIDIAKGIATDSTNAVGLRLASAITKQIDAAWAAGTNQGGLASALTLAQDTWYHVFLIGTGAGSSTDVGFDTSLTATNLLSDSGYAYYRRIGSIRTGVSDTNVVQFVQRGDRFTWVTPFVDIDAASANSTPQQYTLAGVPLGFTVLATMNATWQTNTNSRTGMIYTNDQDLTASNHNSGTAPLSNMGGVSGPYTAGQISVFTSSTAQVTAAALTTGPELNASVVYYEDPRGKDGTS